MNDFYTSGNYSQLNPTWDIDDSGFKYIKIKKIITKNKIKFKSICEIGCGSGEILRLFKSDFQEIDIYGYDIAKGLKKLWKDKKDLNLYNQDFIKKNKKKYDLIFFSDVIEHLDNPFEYLNYSKLHSKYIIIYLPLDLSIRSLLFDKLLKRQINKVGHINFYTKNIFLNILRHKGFNVVDFFFNNPHKFKQKNLSPKKLPYKYFRYFLNLILPKEYYSTIFGGETITILIKS